jgi:hypothetical protein
MLPTYKAAIYPAYAAPSRDVSKAVREEEEGDAPFLVFS